MSKSLVVLGTLVLSCIAIADSQQKLPIVRTMESYQWTPAFAEHPEGPKLVLISGDMVKGPSTFLIQVPAGFDSGEHIHTAGYRGVVIQGRVVNPGKGEKNPPVMGPGSTWYQPAGGAHSTACLSGENCISYVQFEGPFDALPHAE